MTKELLRADRRRSLPGLLAFTRRIGVPDAGQPGPAGRRTGRLRGYAEFVTGTQGTPLGLDVTTPNVARMYDYYLGGYFL
jgi:hypothetical protein